MDLINILEQVRENIVSLEDRGKLSTVITQLAFMQEELSKTKVSLHKVTQAWVIEQADNMLMKRAIDDIMKRIKEVR